MSKSRIYTVCVFIFIAGIGLFYFNVKSNLTGLKDSLTELQFPGAHELTLNEVGNYSIYYQFESFINGEKIDSEDISADSFNLEIVKLPENLIVELEKPDSAKKYRYMGRKGIKIYEFENSGKSEYLVKSDYLNGDRSKKYILAIEYGFELKRVKGIISSQAALLLPTLLALILFIRTYIKN